MLEVLMKSRMEVQVARKDSPFKMDVVCASSIHDESISMIMMRYSVKNSVIS